MVGPDDGRRRWIGWSDLAGFVFFTGLAVWTLVRMPAVGVLLIPTLGHELATAFAFVLRGRPRATAPSISSRVTAYAGTFVIFGFFHAAREGAPEWLVPGANATATFLGLLLWLAGSLIALASIWTLRRAFSIEPEARQLVESGPYHYARHPIYAGYALQLLGLLAIYPTVAFSIAVFCWLVLTAWRIHFEEQVLARAFPEYEDYRHRVGALGPWHIRPHTGSTALDTELPRTVKAGGR